MVNMPPITKNLIIINLIFFLGKFVALRFGVDLDDLLGLHFFVASDFRIWQLVSYLFMHGSFAHILFNMFAVWMFGRLMESYWGSKRFLIYYLVCGIGAGIIQEGVQYATYIYRGLADFETVNTGYSIISMSDYLNRWTTIGASGAVYGILLSFGMTFPEERLFIFPLPMPIKAKYFVIGYAVIELLSGLGNSGDGVAHFAHLGGMAFGALLIIYWRRNDCGYHVVNQGFIQRLRKWFTNFRRPKMNTYSGPHKEDYEYNARRRDNEQEIDRILEKVRKDGYKNLTEEEKRKLFDESQR